MLYELTILYRKGLDAEKVSEKVETIIKSLGGEVKSKTNEGLKKLHYEIEGENMATFYFYELVLSKDIPQKIISLLENSDGVGRFLLIKSAKPQKHIYFIKKKYGAGVFDNMDKQWAIDDVKHYIAERTPSIGKRQEFAEARLKMEQATGRKFDVSDYLTLAVDMGILD